MTRTRTFFIVPFIILAAFTFTHAQSAAELQAQLAALLQQLSALQAQLPATSGGSAPAPSVSTGGGSYGQCPNLSRTLRMGMSGSDVSSLQAFLASDPSLYPEGTVSGYFGGLTQAAVQRFQVRQGIVSSGTPDSTGYGLVGPGTRAAIARVCGGGASVPGPVSGGGCSVGGTIVPSGSTVQLYSVSQAPSGASCSSYAQTRQCINGALSGSSSHVYTSCSSATQSQCYVDGNTIPNGSSRTFYSQNKVSYGSSCGSYSQQRTCTNGVMSGSSNFYHTSCSVGDASACVVGDVSVPHASSRTFYKKSLVAYGESCSSSANALTRTCTTGTITGDTSFNKPSCTSATSSSCTLDGFAVQNGSTRDYYNTRTSPYTTGTTCAAQYKLTRKCVNGIFDGDDSFKYATCSIGAGSSCRTEDGRDVAHGTVVPLYKSPSVAYNGNCEAAANKVNRTCTNGVFSGTGTTLDFKYFACSPATAGECTTADNVKVPHASTTAMYTTASVAYGSTCTKVNRTCTNGSFGTTNAGYTYYRCSVGGAPAPTCTLQTEKVAYKPGEQVTLKWTTSNAINGTLISNGVQLGTSISGTSLASGSRANATSYSSIGDKTVSMNVMGNQSTTGQCSAVVKVQDILPPTCTLTIQKGTATPTSSVLANYGEPLTLRWTSSGATDYATSSPNVLLSATTSLNVAGGTRVITERESAYTYVFSNAGGSTSCTVNVAYNAPTCVLNTDPVTSATTKFKIGDSAKLVWTSTNADYTTLSTTGSSSRRTANSNATFDNITTDTNFSFTFAGVGGTKVCSRMIDVDTPMTMSGPAESTYQPGNTVQVSWTYVGAAAAVKVNLTLVDSVTGVKKADIATGLPSSGGYAWTIPSGWTQGGQYVVRATAMNGTTLVTRVDGFIFDISIPVSYLSNAQVAAALTALEALLKDALVRLNSWF